ncbi:hypothetical protein, partial [Enterococcus faecium]
FFFSGRWGGEENAPPETLGKGVGKKKAAEKKKKEKGEGGKKKKWEVGEESFRKEPQRGSVF